MKMEISTEKKNFFVDVGQRQATKYITEDLANIKMPKASTFIIYLNKRRILCGIFNRS